MIEKFKKKGFISRGDLIIKLVEIFGVNTLRGKLHQQGSPNLQDIFIGAKLLWD